MREERGTLEYFERQLLGELVWSSRPLTREMLENLKNVIDKQDLTTTQFPTPEYL